jgi:hypothetical protein
MIVASCTRRNKYEYWIQVRCKTKLGKKMVEVQTDYKYKKLEVLTITFQKRSTKVTWK